jgi:class 3 adenylate cyclase
MSVPVRSMPSAAEARIWYIAGGLLSAVGGGLLLYSFVRFGVTFISAEALSFGLSASFLLLAGIVGLVGGRALQIRSQPITGTEVFLWNAFTITCFACGAIGFVLVYLQPQAPLIDRLAIALARSLVLMVGVVARLGQRLSLAQQLILEQKSEIEKQQQRTESLLLNILPAEVAAELKEKGAVDPQYHEDVTIVFTDFKGFTRSCETISAGELVGALHHHFCAFDEITRQYGLEKLKTISDSYMCVAGLPERRPSHAIDAMLAAFQMLEAVERGQYPPMSWPLRIGVHTGPVVSGVVGVTKFAFDIWGDSVNLASRMESSGAPNRINVSPVTYTRIKDFFVCEERGKVRTKDDRELEMYFAVGAIPALMVTIRDGRPQEFATRYESYFRRPLPHFPACLLPKPRAT